METKDDSIETQKRWKMILGSQNMEHDESTELSDEEEQMEAALAALYEFEHTGKFQYSTSSGQTGGNAKSNLSIAKWLGDIRKYFPNSVVHVLQRDAMRQPVLQQKLMFEPEILEQTTPDIHLVVTLLELKKQIPNKTRETAKYVVKRVVEDLMERLKQKTIAALLGAINRNTKNRRPKYYEMDWNTTILKNLKHYQPNYKTIIPEIKVGFGRKRRQQMKDIILCLDQSASMASSVVYASIFASVMASLPALKTRLVAFDIDILDLTEFLEDPVDLIFGVQLGGGTDINKALKYCQDQITKPTETILILISDLFEGGNLSLMQQRLVDLKSEGVQMIALLALNDEGIPSYDVNNAKFLAALQIPVFACTPNLFPEMMAAAINGQDLSFWASQKDIKLLK